jgi:hypothetical protein
MKYYLLIGTAKEPNALPSIILKLRSFKGINRAFKELRDEGAFTDLETVEIERPLDGFTLGDNLGHKIQAVLADRCLAHQANRQSQTNPIKDKQWCT